MKPKNIVTWHENVLFSWAPHGVRACGSRG
jgi:hypothetical protein